MWTEFWNGRDLSMRAICNYNRWTIVSHLSRDLWFNQWYFPDWNKIEKGEYDMSSGVFIVLPRRDIYTIFFQLFLVGTSSFFYIVIWINVTFSLSSNWASSPSSFIISWLCDPVSTIEQWIKFFKSSISNCNVYLWSLCGVIYFEWGYFYLKYRA